MVCAGPLFAAAPHEILNARMAGDARRCFLGQDVLDLLIIPRRETERRLWREAWALQRHIRVGITVRGNERATDVVLAVTATPWLEDCVPALPTVDQLAKRIHERM